MQESPRDIIQDRIGNPIILMGGLYARACNHPDQTVRNLWRILRMSAKLIENTKKILEIEESQNDT